MPVMISLLRGVNVGGHNRIKMDVLRDLYASLRLRDPVTYVQSGNVVFRSEAQDPDRLAARIGKAIEKGFGFRPEVVVRTAAEMEAVIAANPFAARPDLDPAKFLVLFLSAAPTKEAREKLAQVRCEPEELRAGHRELYIYYTNGLARPKLPWMTVEKILQTPGTGRNWNTVLKLRQIAQEMSP